MKRLSLTGRKLTRFQKNGLNDFTTLLLHASLKKNFYRVIVTDSSFKMTVLEVYNFSFFQIASF